MLSAAPPREGLHRLIYLSRFSDRFPLAVQDQDREVCRIIQASIPRNRLAAVTGLLLVRGEQFLQALEGPAWAVHGTYDRIVADPRHCEPQLISEGPVTERRFGEWTMCVRRVSKCDDAILRTLDIAVAPDLGALTPAKALGLLAGVRNLQDRRLLAATI